MKAKHRSSICIQRNYRGYVNRAKYLQQLESAKFLQALARGTICRSRYVQVRAACIAIQACARRYVACRKRQSLIKEAAREIAAAVTIQQRYRGYRASEMYSRIKRSAVVLQALIRGRKARSDYKSMVSILNRSAAVITSQWRGHVERCQYLKIKDSVTALQSVQRRRWALKCWQRSKSSSLKIQAYIRGHRARKLKQPLQLSRISPKLG